MGRYEAIYRRKSIRKYSQEEVHVGIFDELRELIKDSKKLYDDIDMDFIIVENGIEVQKVMHGLIGGYGKIKAPHYIVATSEVKEGYLENVGFALESVVLGLTDMGIGTCWIGGNYKKETFEDIIDIKDNHVPVIIIAFGYVENENDLIRRAIKSKNRMDVNDFTFGIMPKEWINIMEAVKAAPSAVNGQPWRFFVDEDTNTIDAYAIIKSGLFKKELQVTNRIDMGIGLCHLCIAAENFDKDIEFKKMTDKGKSGYTYITSIIDKE
jgi:nitroreductase